jgi:CRISPR-associated protein Cas6
MLDIEREHRYYHSLARTPRFRGEQPCCRGQFAVSSREQLPFVDCSFGLFPASSQAALPADNAYLIYAAVSRILPWFHNRPDLGIHPLRGRLVGKRSMLLPKRSTLTFRAPAELIGPLLALAGKTLTVAGVPLMVGTPNIRPLTPAALLSSRLVIIRGFQEPDAFLAAVQRQIEKMGVAGEARLVSRRSPTAVETGGKGGQGEWVRRTMRVKDKEIVGFAVEVGALSATDSLKLQEVGLGGRRKFGCGVLVQKRTPR